MDAAEQLAFAIFYSPGSPLGTGPAQGVVKMGLHTSVNLIKTIPHGPSLGDSMS